MVMFKEQDAPLTAIIAALCLGTISGTAIAQASHLPEDVPAQKLQLESKPPPGQFMQTLPVIAALDVDKNGELSAEEILGAAEALKKLDTSKDGILTHDEFRPKLAGRGKTPPPGNSPPVSPAELNPAIMHLPPLPDKIAGISPRGILKLFGARGKDGVTTRTLESYRRVFGFTDFNKDGRHSKKEYINGGRHLTRGSRSGIFQASDSNRDGFVSRDEYVMNRIITDEAKEIFSRMDRDNDNKLTADEVMASGKLKNRKQVNEVFGGLDTNGDGTLSIPEYLHVWGRWARS